MHNQKNSKCSGGQVVVCTFTLYPEKIRLAVNWLDDSCNCGSGYVHPKEVWKLTAWLLFCQLLVFKECTDMAQHTICSQRRPTKFLPNLKKTKWIPNCMSTMQNALNWQVLTNYTWHWLKDDIESQYILSMPPVWGQKIVICNLKTKLGHFHLKKKKKQDVKIGYVLGKQHVKSPCMYFK